MAIEWRGEPVASAIREDLLQRAALLKEKGRIPTLAIVRVGERSDEIAYEKSAGKQAQKAGVRVQNVLFSEGTSQSELVAELDRLSEDDQVHGILLLRPLPPAMDEMAVCNHIVSHKDVDGVTDLSLSGVFTGASVGHPPCTAEACIELLNYYGVSILGKQAVVVGRSLVVGRPVALMLLEKSATVTICHSKTENLLACCRQADILVAAAGKQGLITAEMVSPGQILLDVGIHVQKDGSLTGDISPKAAAVAEAYTPVPGGVGTVTSTLLMRHVIQAAEQKVQQLFCSP